jgi:aerobic carbon-monoxide dehydrogenase large subunit
MPDDSIFDRLKFGIGQPVLRNEDPRLLTGGGQYTDDANVDGQAHAYLLRSTVAHGEIRSIDVTAAQSAPGVLAVYTGADLKSDGLGDLPCGMPFKSRDGTPLVVPPRPALTIDRVRHVGDAFAVVIAETPDQARDAAELIDADIAALPAISDRTRADAPGAPTIHDGAPNNVCLDFFLGDEEAAAAAFAKAHHVTSMSIANTRMVVNAMEPRAAIGEYDAATEKFTLHVPSQGVAGFRNVMANAIFKVKPENMRVISDDVGGSFGMKGGAFNEAVCCLYAARKLNRPVKWCADRSESFMSDHHGRASDINAELALDKDGNILALRITGYGDLGAYVTAMGPGPSTGVLSRNIISVYQTPILSYGIKAVLTNTVPTGPYRGAGRPESKYIVEQLMDKAARETGIDRIELRRRNLIPADAMPYDCPHGITYDSGEFEAIMDEAMKQSDWDGFDARRKQSEASGKIRGIGLSVYLETTAPSGSELADIRFEDDGTVTVIAGSRDFGMGHSTPFAQLLGQRLGIPFERINLVQNDSDLMSAGAGGSGGSRTAIATGGAIMEASDIIQTNGIKASAFVLEAAEEDIEFAEGYFRVAGTDRMITTLALAADLAKRTSLPDGVPAGLDAKVAHTTAPSSYPNGCHVCEVEIDPDTGLTDILRYTVVDDFGVVLNPLVVEGQVQGGIVQGIGQVMMENTVYDSDGQLLTGSYMDYAMPRADDLPSFGFSTRNVPCTTNALGVKGCGEAGNSGSMAATMNAITDALVSAGAEPIDAPASPDRVWSALRS